MLAARFQGSQLSWRLKGAVKVSLADLCHSRYSVYMPLKYDSYLLQHFDRIIAKIMGLGQ